MAVVGEVEIEAIGDPSEDGKLGPGDRPAAPEHTHGFTHRVHGDQHLAGGGDQMHDATHLGGVELVLLDELVFFAEVDGAEQAAIVV